MTAPVEFSIDDFDPDTLPRDSVPLTADIEYPCQHCGREAGPYSGRGRKPKVCVDCKPRKRTSVPKVTGSSATLATQATEVLSQVNAMVALGCAAMKLFGTAGAISAYDETFKAQAYAALITDQELCRFILKGGTKSAKVTLLMAYGGMAVAVAPHAVNEVKEMRAERQARKEAEGVDG